MNTKIIISCLLIITQELSAQAVSENMQRFLTEALEVREDNSVEVMSYDVKPVTTKGDNTLSVLQVAHVQYSVNTSLIIKRQIMDSEDQRIETGNLMSSEAYTLFETLPGMNAVLPKEHRLNPTAFFYQEEEPMMIAMENLAPLGYKMFRMKIPSLDLDHSLLVMDVIARFHAASVCLYQNELTSYYKTGPTSEGFKELIKRVVKRLGTEMKSWTGEANKYSEKVLKMSKKLGDLYGNASLYRENDYNVLNHGDLYGNNVMFKYNSSNQPTDAILVDFQTCEFNSPVQDLLEFIATSVSDNVYFNDVCKLIERYHSTFTSTVEKIPCTIEPPSMEILQKQIHARAILDMQHTFITLSYFVSIQEKEGKSNNSSNEEFVSAFYNEEYRELLAKRLPLYDQMGLFDLESVNENCVSSRCCV